MPLTFNAPSPLIPAPAVQDQQARNRAAIAAMPAPALSTSSPFATPPPAIPSAPLPSVGISRSLTDEDELHRMQSTGSGVSQIQNPFLRGIARVADIASAFVAPRLSQLVPGTTLHHQQDLARQSGVVQQDEAIDQSQAKTTQERALATQEQAKAEALSDPHKAVDPSKTVQTDDGVFQLNPDTGKYDVRVGDRVDKPQTPEQAAYEYAVSQGKNPMDAYSSVYSAKNQKDASLSQQYMDALSSGDKNKASLIQRAIHDTQVQPKIDVHAAEAPAGGSGTWSMAFQGDKPVMFNTKTGEVKDADGLTRKATGPGGKGTKPNVDEQKRADFAQNMGENINIIEDVLSRRPELFGPIAGRVTGMKASMGSDDVDIAKLEAAEHQLAMVSQGVHGMRSSQGLEGAARSLLNGFKNSPAATRAALETARSSTKTFLSDADHPGETRSQAAPGPVKSYNPKTGKIE